MSTSRIVFQICLVLVIVGAVNWGLVALDPKNDLILCVFPDQKVIRSILYGLIGLAGLVASYIWLSVPKEVCDIPVLLPASTLN